MRVSCERRPTPTTPRNPLELTIGVPRAVDRRQQLDSDTFELAAAISSLEGTVSTRRQP